MKLAVIADVHGNALALEAVLAAIRSEAPDLIVDLGDRVSGPLWPRETVELFRGLDVVGVRGNHDREVATRALNAMGKSDLYAAEVIDAADRAALGALPATATPAPGVLAFHASPDNDLRYLTERIEAGALVHRDIEAIAADLAGVAPGRTLILAGHSHRPFLARLPNGAMMLNPGSVGCPAYDDDQPPHVSESGSPHARFALVRLGAAGVEAVRLEAVAYDWETAARRAEANGRAEWALALRTGRMR